MKLPSLGRMLPWRKRAAEGAYRPGPYMLSDGWLSASAGRLMNFWQAGYSVQPYSGSSAIVEACVSAYAQTIAMCPGDHWRKLENGGRERVTNSALSRVIKKPNDYTSSSDFILNLTRRLYEKGEAFAYAVENNRFEISELHLMREGRAGVALDGSIFYALYGNDVAERRFNLSVPIPARHVLHVRLNTGPNDLKGVSPLIANQLSLALSGAAMSQQIAFYINQARPSFMLETDEKLNRDQVRELREGWNEQTQGENSGGTPILAWGLKAKPVTGNPTDGQLAELLKSTREDVALVYQIPLQVLGIGGTPFASTEALISAWKARGLGFALNHIEEAFGLLFGLKGMPDEYLEFDTKALMRSSFKERIEALGAGTITGIFSPDEARAEEDLPAIPGGFGKMPRVQQQVVGLDWHDKNPAPVPTSKPPSQSEEGDESESESGRMLRLQEIFDEGVHGLSVAPSKPGTESAALDG